MYLHYLPHVNMAGTDRDSDVLLETVLVEPERNLDIEAKQT